jgi:hypothetical protein
MSNCEYCAVVIGGGSGGKHVVLTYKPDGCIKQELDAAHDAASVVQELGRAGWEFAFRDAEGPHQQLFFRRPSRSVVY